MHTGLLNLGLNNPLTPNLGAQVQSSFANGEQGAWFDPSDQGTLFQDSAGTTPVTAVEQPVGLMLDKRLGLVLGPELVSNGSFDTNVSGWTPTGSATITWQAPGYLRLTRATAGTFPVAMQAITTVVGKRYLVSVDVITNANGLNLYAAIGGATIVASTSGVGRLSFIHTATSTSSSFDFGINGASGSIGNFVDFGTATFRELPGNHAFQTTAINRPTFSARVNLLTKTEQFGESPWGRSNATATGGEISPIGTATASRLTANATTAVLVTQTISSVPITSGIYRIFVKQGSGPNDANRFAVYNNTTALDLVSVSINYSTGVLTQPIGSGATSRNAGNGWWEITMPFTASAGNTVTFYPCFVGGMNVAGEFALVWGASVVSANQSHLPYQRVNTATDYDSAGFPKYLASNGVNQWMQTADINLTGTDQVTVVAGVRKLSDATNIVFESSVSSGTNPNCYAVYSDTQWTMRSKGVMQQDATTPGLFLAPVTNVVTGQGNINGDISSIRTDGVTRATNSADQGTGNYGNYPLYLFSRAGTSLFFNGQFYGAIINARPTGIPTQTLTYFERYVNQNTRITLA